MCITWIVVTCRTHESSAFKIPPLSIKFAFLFWIKLKSWNMKLERLSSSALRPISLKTELSTITIPVICLDFCATRIALFSVYGNRKKGEIKINGAENECAPKAEELMLPLVSSKSVARFLATTAPLPCHWNFIRCIGKAEVPNDGVAKLWKLPNYLWSYAARHLQAGGVGRGQWAMANGQRQVGNNMGERGQLRHQLLMPHSGQVGQSNG